MSVCVCAIVSDSAPKHDDFDFFETVRDLCTVDHLFRLESREAHILEAQYL